MRILNWTFKGVATILFLVSLRSIDLNNGADRGNRLWATNMLISFGLLVCLNYPDEIKRRFFTEDNMPPRTNSIAPTA